MLARISKIVLLLLCAGALVVLAAYVRELVNGAAGDPDGQTVCTLDAKICPDGSAVGRVGPSCEFAACPGEASSPHSAGTLTREVVVAKVGQTIDVLGEELTLVKISQDSRCPSDVQCIWQGTVIVEARIQTAMGMSAMSLELGKESTTEINSYTLTKVEPAALTGATIEEDSYRMTIDVVRR